MTESNIKVKLTKLPNDVKISTVFLRIDYSLNSNIPILFETMIFGGKYNFFQERYATWDEAKKKHQKIVDLVKKNKLKIY